MTIDAGTNAELTALRARVAELESERDALGLALEKYGTHLLRCKRGIYGAEVLCDCGLYAARQRKEGGE